MPEFILPAEADRCPHCDKVLTAPPSCCDEAKKDWQQMEEYDLSQWREHQEDRS